MPNQQTSQDQQQQQARSTTPQNQQGGTASSSQSQQAAQPGAPADFDGLKDKKPDELTPEELRLMADTMPGEGPGD